MSKLKELLDKYVGARKAAREVVYFSDTEQRVEGEVYGLRHNVEFRVRGRPVYSAHLFTYWINIDGVVQIRWGDEMKEFRQPDKLKQQLEEIFNHRNVQTSIRQLEEFAEEGNVEGVVRTVDENTLAGNDFMVEVPGAEYKKIEDAFNTDQQFSIVVRESSIRQLAARFHPTLPTIYRLLDVQGMVMDIVSIQSKGAEIEIMVRDVR